MSGHTAAAVATHGRSPGAAAAAAGLVPSKTTRGCKLLSVGDQFRVSLEPEEQALNRIKRLKRAVWASGHLHKLAETGHRPPVCWFVTLTYADANAWRAEHVSDAVHGFRNWCRRRKVPCRYTWVGEIQTQRLAKTGEAVVHYHLLAWLPVGHRMPHWDRRADSRPAWWHHGMSNTEPAKAGVGYLMKYLSKLGQFHRFPKGLRLYGIGGLTSDGKAVRSWINLPQWAKHDHGVGDLKRLANHLVVRATAEILESPYRVQKVPGGLIVRLIRALPSRPFAGPYSTYPRVIH